MRSAGLSNSVGLDANRHADFGTSSSPRSPRAIIDSTPGVTAIVDHALNNRSETLTSPIISIVGNAHGEDIDAAGGPFISTLRSLVESPTEATGDTRETQIVADDVSSQIAQTLSRQSTIRPQERIMMLPTPSDLMNTTLSPTRKNFYLSISAGSRLCSSCRKRAALPPRTSRALQRSRVIELTMNVSITGNQPKRALLCVSCITAELVERTDVSSAYTSVLYDFLAGKNLSKSIAIDSQSSGPEHCLNWEVALSRQSSQ